MILPATGGASATVGRSVPRAVGGVDRLEVPLGVLVPDAVPRVAGQRADNAGRLTELGLRIGGLLGVFNGVEPPGVIVTSWPLERQSICAYLARWCVGPAERLKAQRSPGREFSRHDTATTVTSVSNVARVCLCFS